MMPQRITNRTLEIFNDALAQPVEKRLAFLAEACRGDERLLRRVKELLDAYEAVRTTRVQNLPGSGLAFPVLPAGAMRSLEERYEDICPVGIGGMGIVFRARDREINKVVALKVLNPLLAGNDRAVERFKIEIQLALEITHKNVCRAYALQPLNGALAISMEFVEGETLRAILDRVKGVSIQQGLLWAAEICDALAAAHEHRIVHRDLKPENIMVDLEGHIKVMDFGIARSLDVTGDPLEDSAGTPSYMSPEQREGRPIGPTSDIYSLGLVLYELFTGVRREPGSAIPPGAVDRYLPPHIDAAISRCLEPDAAHRFQTVSELGASLVNGYESGQRGTAARRQRFRRRAAIVGIPLLAAALIALLLVRKPPPPPPPSPPQDKINALAFSPDGRLLASGSEDATIIIWDAVAQRRIRTLVNHVRAVTAVTFSADSRWLASGSGDTTIKIAEVATGRVLASFPDTKEILAMALSPDGRWLASTTDQSIKLWDVSSGSVVRTMSHRDQVNDLVFRSDGRLLTSASTDRTVGVWDVQTGRRLAKALRHDDLVQAVAFSPDGSLLASGSYDKTVKLWSIATSDTVQTLWEGERVSDISFSRDGTTLLSISDRGTVRIWRAPTWRLVATLPSKEPAKATAWAFDPDGRSLAIGLDDGHVLVQNLPALPNQ